jgi:hypothetical protein
MIGHPKYAYGDMVSFEIDGTTKVGKIYIIDAYGTFFDDSDVSYDIMVDEGEMSCLYKHLPERYVTLFSSHKK